MKVGDLVKVKHVVDQVYIGVLIKIEDKKELFSEKYSVYHHRQYIHILCNDKVEVFDSDECVVGVISEL